MTVRGVGYKAGVRNPQGATDGRLHLPFRRPARTHLLAPVDPGTRRGRARGALGRGRLRRRLGAAPADPDRACSTHRVEPCWPRRTPRWPRPNRAARRRAAPAATPTSSRPRWATCSSSAGGSRGSRWCSTGPVGADRAPIDEGAPILTPRPGHGQRSRVARSSTSARWPPPPGPTPASAPTGEPHRCRASSSAPSWCSRPTAASTRLYFLFPLDEEQETLALVTRALVTAALLLLILVAGLTWLVTRQVVTPGAAGAPGRRAAGGGAAAGAPAGHGRGRPRAAGDLVQPDGEQPAAPDPPARGAEPGPAAVRLRRLPRAADAAHHRPDGRRRAARRPAVLRPGDVARGRAAAERARPVRDAAGRPARDQPLRRRRRRARPRRGQPGRRRAPGRRPDPGAGRPAAHPRGGRRPATTRAWPRPTYDGWSGSCATWSPTPSTTPRRHDVVVHVAGDDQAAAIAVRDYGVGLRPGESAMVFNRFWRADPARARTSGGTGLGLSISLEDTHLHGGWLQAWGRLGEGSQFRLTLPRRAGTPLRQSPLPLVPMDAREVVGMRRAFAPRRGPADDAAGHHRLRRGPGHRSGRLGRRPGTHPARGRRGATGPAAPGGPVGPGGRDRRSCRR